MLVYKQEKKELHNFLNDLKKSYELIAPVKKDLVRFEKIDDVGNIYLKENSYFPIKQYMFKKEEKMFSFDGLKMEEIKPENPERIFFGVRKCDLNAIRHQDIVFINDVKDPYYRDAREKITLIGYHCNEAPSEYCFCESLELVDYHDLMFYEKGDYFLVEVGSEKGKKIVQRFKKYFEIYHRAITQEEKHIKKANRLKDKDISGLYDNPGWKKGVDICLSCTACTSLCPTCYCFEIKDNVSTKDVKKGERVRNWSSCQTQEFTKVAGDYVFRQEREHRFKHRIYHQLEYFKERYGVDLCVGCGRCISGCPTRIDFVEIINEMKNAKRKT